MPGKQFKHLSLLNEGDKQKKKHAHTFWKDERIIMACYLNKHFSEGLNTEQTKTGLIKQVCPIVCGSNLS